MSFWDNVFQTPHQSQQVASIPTQPRAWWQDQDTVQAIVQSQGVVVSQENQGLSEAELRAIRKRGHNQINAEQAEAIAEYDLTHKDKYLNECPQCGSGNFLPAGTRMGGVIMPTNKCFNCGGGARSPEPAVGGSSGRGSIATRQTDTGGGGGNMFGTLTGVPRSYMPRP